MPTAKNIVNTQAIAVLWDASHIWGLMALRALRALGFSVQVLKSTEIAQGGLFSKQAGVLLVPGGAARRKAEGLGQAGKQAIRDFVAQGGRYIGFCGGAGLALSHDDGLGLCPWGRTAYPERILHLLSGHIRAIPEKSSFSPDWEKPLVSLPVWWPGRFSNGGGDVEVLARALLPDKDFWIADIPLQDVPQTTFTQWKRLCGIDFSGDFLANTELIVHGAFGKGEYILSYSHLETPDSPDANHWLRHILYKCTGQRSSAMIPPWNLLLQPQESSAPREILWSLDCMRKLEALAIRHRLFFIRTPWLAGWKPSLPGSVCANLLAALYEASSAASNPYALSFWEKVRNEYECFANEFFPRAEGCLLAIRLAETLSPSMPTAIDKTKLSQERLQVFGHPMTGGGILGKMQDLIEEYLFRCLSSVTL